MDASWDSYVVYAKSGPQLIYVDRSYHSSAPLKSLPVRVDCMMWPLAVDKFKLPAPSALKLISKVETRVQFATDSWETAYYVGRVSISDGTIFSYYTADGLRMIRTFETSAKIPHTIKHQCSQERDDSWLWYQKALYPSPLNLNKLENDKILVTLQAQGDNGSVRRKVVHSAHFSNSRSLEAFATRIVADEYVIEHRSGMPDSDGQWRVSFSKDQAPVMMDVWTWSIRQRIAEFKGVYDGWKTSTIHPGK